MQIIMPVRGCRWTLMISVIVLAWAFSRSAVAANDAVENVRLEKMLADGDTGMVVQVFKRHPGQTLPFIDSYLEGGLAIIEKGQDDAAGSAAKALDQFRIGIRFAKLADEAFSGSAFSGYANSFASWSASEQKSFRQGQQVFKQAMKVGEPTEAVARLKESLALARPLNDAWGQAMAHAALAEKFLQIDDHEQALGHASSAIVLYRALQMEEDLIAAYRLAAGSYVKVNAQIRTRYLAQAWEVIEGSDAIDKALRQSVLDEYLAALTAADMSKQADELRRRNAEVPKP